MQARAFNPPLPWISVALVTAMSAIVGSIAADARWLAALGGAIGSAGSIPRGVPWASAPSAGWHNVPVLAELTFHALDAVAGARGLLAAQVLAVGLTLVLLLRDQRAAGAGDRGAAIALVLLAPAAFAALIAVRSQLFSLPLFALVLLLLREERRAPSRRIWLLVPIVIVWSNLHGAVLSGLAVAGAYLLLDRLRRRPLESLAVLVASLASLCLTPALAGTPAYFAAVLSNEAARRGVGLWAPPSLASGLDIVFALAALALAAGALRSRPALWELVAAAGLLVLTVRAARGEVWLALFLATPAAVGFRGPSVVRPRLAGPVLLAFALVAAIGLARGPIEVGAGRTVLQRALAAAHGSPILAEDQLAEQIALAGGRVWVSNPLDAFSTADQRLYLQWSEGDAAGRAALSHAPRAALVRLDSGAARLIAATPGWRVAARDPHALLYVRMRVG